MHPFVRDVVIRAYLDTIARNPDAMAFLLSTVLDVEATEEARFFDAVLPHVDAPLRKAVARHHADEDRHVGLVRECLAIIGRDPVAIPDHLRPVHVADAAVGGILSGPLGTREELGRAYLFLHVLEGRMSERLPIMAAAFEGRWPGVAAILREIAADERRHVGYCAAVSRALLADDATWQLLRDEMARAEARSYPRYSANQVLWLAEHSFQGRARRGLWRVVGRVALATTGEATFGEAA